MNQMERMESLFDALVIEIENIKKKFIPIDENKIFTTSNIEELNIKSFIILSHAAFENYVELLAIYVAEYAIDDYLINHTYTDAVVSFIRHKLQSPVYDGKLWHPQTPSLGQDLRDAFDKFRGDINDSNHGLKPKHLDKVFRPVGISFPRSPMLQDALNQLCDLRGKYAHRFLEKIEDQSKGLMKLQKIKDPDEVIEAVHKSLRLMFIFHINAINAIQKKDSEYALLACRKYLIRLLCNLRVKNEFEPTPDDSIFNV